MTQTHADVVVIGAGALGLCAAYHLTAMSDARVTVIDKSHIASGSSGLSVGIIETQYLDPLAIELRVVSMNFFSELEQGGKVDITRNGYLRLGHSVADLYAFERSVAVQASLGVGDALVLDRDDIKRLIPDMYCEDLAGGLFGPSDGYIDGHLYCNALARLVTERGGRILPNVVLQRCEVGPEDTNRLRTSRGELSAIL